MDITIPVTWKSVGTAITALIGIVGTTSYVVWVTITPCAGKAAK